MSMQPIVDRTQEYQAQRRGSHPVAAASADPVALNDAGKDPLVCRCRTIRPLPFLTRSYRNPAAGRTWPLEIRVLSSNETSGRVVGDCIWPQSFKSAFNLPPD